MAESSAAQTIEVMLMNAKTIALFDLSVTADSPAGSCILQMLKGLCQDYQFTVFADRFENPAPDQITWVRVPLPPKPVLLRYVVFKWLAALSYRQHVRHHGKPDLIIGTEGQFPACDISYAHFCHQAYLTQHKVKASLPRKLARLLTRRFNADIERQAFASAEAIVVPSQGLATEIEQTYTALVQKKITVIPNPVDIQRFTRPVTFDRQAFRSQLGFGPNDQVIVFSALGDFDRKGLNLLLQAIAAINNARVKLLIVGGSLPEVREYETIRDRLQLSNQAVFVGFQSDVRPYLWSADLFALPSQYETFSLATFQAAAAGLPVLVTKLYGVEEFLKDGINGWLVERDAASLAGAIQQAVADPTKLAQLGSAAHTGAHDYDAAIFVERWRAILRSLMGFEQAADAPHSLQTASAEP